MTPAQQKSKSLSDKLRAERRLKRELPEWIREIVFSYNIGDTTATPEAIPELQTILNKFYRVTAKDVLSFDIREYKNSFDTETKTTTDINTSLLKIYVKAPRGSYIKKVIAGAIKGNYKHVAEKVFEPEYKQFGDEPIKDRIFANISRSLRTLFTARTPAAVRQIMQTASKRVERTTQLAYENGYSQIEARRTLANFLKNQSLTISTTESQWIVETTRNISVINTTVPLKNLADEVVDMLQNGNLAEALNLSKQVKDLIKLPTSVNQGEVISVVIDNTKIVVDPINDRDNITTIKEAANKLGKDEKEWANAGDGDVRESHIKANGQRRKLDQPFNLLGGLVRYPGDGSLGAALAEIIRCRCAAIYY